MKKNIIIIIVAFIVCAFIVYQFAFKKRLQYNKDKKKYFDILQTRFDGWLNWIGTPSGERWRNDIKAKAQANNISLNDQFISDWVYDLTKFRNNKFPDGTEVPIEFIYEWKNQKLTGQKYSTTINNDTLTPGI